jgi:hypothetical protein
LKILPHSPQQESQAQGAWLFSWNKRKLASILGNGKRQNMISMTAFAVARPPLHGFIENTPPKKAVIENSL